MNAKMNSNDISSQQSGNKFRGFRSKLSGFFNRRFGKGHELSASLSEKEILGQLVRIRSISGEEQALGKFLEAYLSKLGFSTMRQPIGDGTRFNLLAERQGRGSCVLLYGHMDTVPPYGTWDSDPFTPRIDGDRLYGLGAWDMKGGIAAILSAAETPGRHVKIAFCADEESISRGAWALAKSDFLDGVSIAIAADSGLNPRGESGPHMITLGRRGRCVARICVKGQSAHGSSSGGINAISQAARLILAMESQGVGMMGHGLLPGSSAYVSSVQGGTTTLSVPDEAVIKWDAHLVPPQTSDGIINHLRAYANMLTESGIIKGKITVELEPRETPYLEPYLTPQGQEYVQTMEKIVCKQTGASTFNYGLSVADENILATKVPVMTIGPSGENEHMANEYVSISSVEKLSSILKEFLNLE